MSNADSNEEMLNFLEQFTVGEANTIIYGFNSLDADIGYPVGVQVNVDTINPMIIHE